MATCGNAWGDPYGYYYPPCNPIDAVAIARGRARQRMLEDPWFDALVRTLGTGLDSVESDAWALLNRISAGMATGVLLERWGEDFGLPKPSLQWDSARYRKVLGAWLPAQMGAKSVPKLLALLGALADGEVYTVEEMLPNQLVISVTGLDGGRASIWAQVLEAARPKTVGWWLDYTVINPGAWVMGDAYMGVDTYIAGSIEF